MSEFIKPILSCTTDPSIRNSSSRRFESIDSTEGCRQDDATTGVISKGKWNAFGPNEPSITSAASTARSEEIEWVDSLSKYVIA
jgi:hypothetical protein